MTLTSVPCQALFLALSVAAVEFTAASHFRGAIIQWKPVDPVNFDGRVLFTHRIAWRRGSREGGSCDANTVAAATIIGGGELLCRSGCSGTIGSLQYQCTDFSDTDDWSAGEGSNEINLHRNSSFEASYTGFNWITLVNGGGSWEIRVKGDLTPRPDNRKINSSPTTTMSPVVRLRHGATHTITIPVLDADGDIIRCRWANSSRNECGGVCQHFPATLDENNCTLTYNANGSLGFYVAAIQVEDFISASSTEAMSSVPVQFLVRVQNLTIPPNVTAPTFVENSPVNHSCIMVGSTYQQQITALSGGDDAVITDISTVSPRGLRRSDLINGSNSRESYIIVTWTPSPSQQGPHIFCYTANDNFGLVSEQTCITFIVEKVPEVINITLRSFGNGTFLLSLQFDQQIKRPTISRYVRVFQADDMQVLSVDVANSTDAVYSGNTLSISSTTQFLSNRMYYLVADSGVAVATASCGLESSPVSRGNDEFGSITLQGCPNPAPMFSGPPTVQPGVVRVNWTAAGSSDPLLTGVRYALYSQCGAETTFQLIDDDIQGLSYNITTLPSLTQYVLRVVVYSDHCLLDVDGLLGDTTDNFTTVCPANTYVEGSPETCQPCPAMSSSPGGVVRACPCMDGYGRVNALDLTLQCLACPGPPLNLRLTSSVPPVVEVQWDRPTTPDMWSLMYRIDWQNGTSAVGDTTDTHGTLSGLKAVTQYTVTITAFTDSTVCAEQSVNFSFNTTQRCPSSAPMFSGPPTVQPGVVRVNWTAAGSSDPLVTGVRYALYSQCGAETTFQLIDDDIAGLSYDITTLPSLTQCVLRVVVYSDHCLLDVDGLPGDTTDNFTTVCPVNEYVGGSPETCQSCPAMSSSPGGVVRVCPCMDGYARFNDSYPLLPCGVPPEVTPSAGISSKTINVGDPITISFTVVNEPAPNVTREGIQWVFTGSNGSINLPCTNSSKYTFSSDCLSLTVKNTITGDAGLYKIKLTTDAGIAMSTVRVSFRKVQPTIVLPLMATTLHQGNTHVFVCAAVADPQPVFVFRFKGERIMSNSSKHTMVTNSTHGTLTVFNLQASDEGTYSCSVSNRYGSVSTAAELTVQVPPVLNLFPVADRDVVEGENFIVSCRARGNPIPSILWFRDDQLLRGNQSISISQYRSGIFNSSQLTVIGFTSDNVGEYSCVATNNLGNHSRSFQVNELVRPIITKISYSNGSVSQNLLPAGERQLSLAEFTLQTELKCEASSSPPPEIIWLKDGIALQNLTERRVITTNALENITQSVLKLKEVQLSDAGNYTCRASNGNVSPIPGNTAWTFMLNIEENNECLPNSCEHNGECIDGLRNYTCNCTSVLENEVVKHYAGRNCSTEVEIIKPPSVTTSPSNVTVELSGRVTLSCSASGNPTPIIQWYKDNSAIEGPQAIGNTFVIQETTPGDRGFYHCEAFSSAGRTRSTEAELLISGIVQFRITMTEPATRNRRKRQARNNFVDVETLRLQILNQDIPVEGNYTATVYSVEPAGANSSEVVITVSTNSTASPTTLTSQLTEPLEQLLTEVPDINQQLSFAITSSKRHDGCPEMPASSTCGNAGLVTWPETEIGHVAMVPCPCGVSNDPLIQELRGTRRCGGTYDTGAMWEEPQCDSCHFSDTRLTLCQLAEVDSPAQLAIELVNTTSNFEGIQSAADLSLVLGLLTSVTDSPDLQQEEVQRDILSSVSNVQQVSTRVLAMSSENSNLSARIFAIVDDVLSVIATKVTPGNPFQFATPEFGVRVEDPSEELGENADTFTPNITDLLSQIMNKTLENVPPAMVDISSTLLNDTTGSIPRISVAIYGSDALFQERSNFSNRKVGSIITDISLRSLDGRVKTIVRPTNSNIVRPTFAKRFPGDNGTNTTCQFWNLTADEFYGAWDSSNCRVLRETDEEVECGCDHLTHFAILLDSNPTPSHDLPDTLLNWVSYIGTVLSSVSLIIIIITYLAEKNLRKELHYKLLLNLCFALVGLYVTFIISTVSTGVPVLCGVVSALMHYFFLAVFFWMAADAIHLHRKLVTVFKPDIKRYFPIALAICWVVPAIIVTLSLAPQYQNYIHSQFCRVYGYSFWIGLLVPFGIIYIMNWVIFILIFVSLLSRPNIRKETSNHGKLRKLKENFTIALGLSLLFGMGWAVGLLATSGVHVAVQIPAEWIFTFMTAFLGVYLFILYILRSSEARGLWKRWLLCQHIKKHYSVGVSASSSSRTKLRDLPSSMRSWWKRLKANMPRPGSASNTNSSMLTNNPTYTSTNTYPTAAGIMNGMTSPHTEPSNKLETITPMEPTTVNLQQVEIELAQDSEKDSLNRESNGKSDLPLEVLMKLNETEFLTEAIMPPNSTPVRSDSLSSIKDATLSSANKAC